MDREDKIDLLVEILSTKSDEELSLILQQVIDDNSHSAPMLH